MVMLMLMGAGNSGSGPEMVREIKENWVEIKRKKEEENRTDAARGQLRM